METINQTLNYYGIDQNIIETCYEHGLNKGEVPVGCVFVWHNNHDGKNIVIAKAHNRTNELNNAIMHAEIDCVHQVVNKFNNYYSIMFQDTIVLVTLEPCIMCCRMLRMLNIKAVLFGAHNDRFGGVGSVYNVHSDERIQDSRLNCFSCLDSNRAISLLHQFYEQTNEKVFHNNKISNQ